MCGGTCRSRKKRGAKPFIDQKQDAFYQALNAFKIATLDKKFPISETEFRDLKQAQQVLADIMDGVQVQRELLFEVGSGS